MGTKIKNSTPVKKGTGTDVVKKDAAVVATVKKVTTGPRYDLLDNWMGLNIAVKDMDEKESLALIVRERANRCRPNVILRLHGRYNRMRALREKTEFMRPTKAEK